MADGLNAAQRMSLLELLGEHQPADGTESEYLGGIRRFVDAHEDPFDSDLSVGHLTGSAFVIDSEWRILLTHHRKLGLWLQLGGHAEAERDAAQVAMREAQEESGLADLSFYPALLGEHDSPRLLDVDVHLIPARAGSPEHYHYDLRFLLVAMQPEEVERSVAESLDLEWVSLGECRRRCDVGICRAVEKIQRLRSSTESLLPAAGANNCASS